MPPHFLVRGGRQLRGAIRPAGNKNAALPILAATVLADGPVELDNVPHIRDVDTMLALLADLGAEVAWTGPNHVRVDARNVRPKPLDPALCARIRASILLAGPLVARFGQCVLPPPGGDVIGRRRVDTHFLALEALGATVELGERYELEAPKGLVGRDIFLDEPSVTGSENALMAATMARGRTVLRNAAAEPHVQDLARCLVAMGAQIEGIGSNVYVIEGGRPLGGASSRSVPIISRSAASSGLPLSPTATLPSNRSGVRISAAPCWLLIAWASGRCSTATACTLRPARSDASAPTSAGTCRSSRMARGPHSRRMSCPPPSLPPPSAPACCWCSRRCSRAGSSSWTS
jgi:UDP-N-acetylglucosamine 1-carboxyvinyltransferase